MRSTGWILTAWMLLPLAGCASLTDFHYEQTQRSRARSAWHEYGTATMPSSYASDYRTGWKDGFYDVATGGKGCPPVVAPCHYWKPSQILADCDEARHAYYSGFQDGVAAALRYPDTHYLKLWTSCECPLPVCENRCAMDVCCPSGPGGLIIQDSFPGAGGLMVPCGEVPCGEPGMEAVEGPDAVREALPYQIDPNSLDSVRSVPEQRQGVPQAMPPATEKADAGQTPRSTGVQAAEPYRLDVRLHRGNRAPIDGSPVEFPGRMIEDDRGSIAPCNLLQYEN